jgi:hypothetical protein
MRTRFIPPNPLVAAMVITSAVPASAQEEGQWFYHPNSGNYWWCAYYGERYWCYTELGIWMGAHSPEMMQYVDGWQPV